MTLTKEQQEICDKRLEEHRHEEYHVDIKLGKDFALVNFLVMRGVFRPETTSGFYLARYFVSNGDLCLKKKVLDLGCGTGIQGIVCALNGASQVSFSDISDLAIKNTELNLKKFNLLDKAHLVCGDLFEKVKGKFDLIIFNHPFFDSLPDKTNLITRAWLDDGKLINKFFRDAEKFLNKEGIIIMPFFIFAGETNNPKIQGEKFGFNVEIIYRGHIIDQNLQKGEFCIFSLKKNFN